MIYELTSTTEDLPMVIVNGNIFFAWDPNDLENYGVFMEQLNVQGIEAFAQLLSENPSTAFSIFTAV